MCFLFALKSSHWVQDPPRLLANQLNRTKPRKGDEFSYFQLCETVNRSTIQQKIREKTWPVPGGFDSLVSKIYCLSNVILDMPELFSECYLHLHCQLNVLKVTKFFSTLFSGGNSQDFFLVVVKVWGVTGCLHLRNKGGLHLKNDKLISLCHNHSLLGVHENISDKYERVQNIKRDLDSPSLHQVMIEDKR